MPHILITNKIKTHKDCSAFKLENEVAITPVKLLELKFLFVIMKEGKAVTKIWKIICYLKKIILMQLVDTHQPGEAVYVWMSKFIHSVKYLKAWQNFFFLLFDYIWKEHVPLSHFL